MANKKAEILTMDGQVVSPITLATNVLLDDGRTAQDLLDSRDESMFSPTITTSSSISKVGQGDNVDFSENIIDGAYKSCVLKGKTLVNHNAEGNDRDEYVCMPSLEGNNLTVNGTVESKVKSAILKGNTLVNIPTTYNRNPSSNGNVMVETTNLSMLKSNTKYLLKIINKSNYDITYYPNASSFIGNDFTVNGKSEGYVILTSLDKTLTHNGIVRLRSSSETIIDLECAILFIEYQDGMENWDIPYFEGMQSVKLPVLTTTGKNLWDDNWSKGLTQTSGNVLTGGTYDGFRYNNNLIPVGGMKAVYLKHFCSQQGVGQFFRVGQYGKDKEWLNKPLTAVNDGIFNVPSDCEYIRIHIDLRYNGASNNTSDSIPTMMVVSTSKITDYEPYKSNILTVNEPVELRGIGDVRDTLDCLTGELTQRICEIILNGSETWTKGTNNSNDESSLFYTSSQNGKGGAGSVISNNFKSIDGYTIDYGTDGIYLDNSSDINIRISNSKLVSNDVNGFKTWLQSNPTTIQYKIKTESIKTVDLSDNVVHSYKDTTHYTCSSAEGSLIPTLSIEEGVKYKAIIKPSTKYSIVFNRTEVASGLTVDLGGATANITSTTLGKNIVQITTLPTLSHNYVKFLGVGNAIKDVQVIEGDVVGDEPYFEGMCDSKMPILRNVGKNLFDGGIGNHYWNAPFTNGVQDIGMQRADNCASTSRIRVRKGETYHLSGVNLIRNVVTFFKTKDSQEKPFHGLSANSFTSPYDGYIEWYISNDNINNPVKNVQIEEGSTTTPYESYKSNILSCETYFNETTQSDKTIVLRSLPNGVCDTLDLETGEYVQRIGELVFDGSDDEDWRLLTASSNWVNFSPSVCTFVFPKPSNCALTWGRGDNENSYLTNKFPAVPSTDPHAKEDKEKLMFDSTNIKMAILKTSLKTEDVEGLRMWLSQNPIITQYELETPITTTIDLKQHPFAYKDGYVVLTSSGEEVSLTPTIEYSLIANRLGQIQTNQKLVEKQQAQIDELESMVITNLVNTQYQQALNEIKLGVK